MVTHIQDAKYIVFPANLSMGYRPRYFKSLEKMNEFLNDAIRRGEIVTVKTVDK